MRKKILNVFTMMITLIFIFAISGCNQSDTRTDYSTNENYSSSDNKSAEPLVGVWVDEDISTSGYIFYEGGTGYSVQSGRKSDIWWSADEDTIIIENDNTTNYCSYRFSGDNTLTIRYETTHVSSITYNRADNEDVFNNN